MFWQFIKTENKFIFTKNYESKEDIYTYPKDQKIILRQEMTLRAKEKQLQSG